ncbi:MAG TPA: tyrosine-protein kinase, partial [Chromatiales bacterium]|nr:tyrosine-protein kinase [Chromatiales bacterium]
MSDTATSRAPFARITRPDLDEIDIAELLGVVLNHKWRLLATTLLAGVVAAVYALSVTPVYRVDALLQVEKKEGGIPGIDELSAALTPEAKSSTEIELLRSRQMLGAAVEQAGLRLDVQPRYLPVLGGWWARRQGPGALAEPLFGLDGYAWGGERVQVTRFDPGVEATRAPWTLVAGEPGQYTLLDDEGHEVLRGRVGEAASGELHGAPVSLFVAELVARPGTPFALTLASAPRAIAA